MTRSANHHFVPQFYFRKWTEGGPRINLLLKKSDRVICNAPIKGQCARNNFYGDSATETMLSQLESRHSASLQWLINFAWSPSGPLEPRIVFDLCEAIILQRARTRLEVDKQWASTEQFLLHMFKDYVRRKNTKDESDEIIRAIENGSVRVTQNQTDGVLLQISVALESVLLISDLSVFVVRNQTDIPFIFGDSPVVFYNTYYRDVTHRGVLGLQTPGLQVFFPLNHKTMLVLYDADIYTGPFVDRYVIDVTEKSDVSQLNALQLHHSAESVYFSAGSEYVLDLWRAHKPFVRRPESMFSVKNGWLVDGVPTDNLLSQFEPHLNIRLDLSFVHCTPFSGDSYEFRRRNPELVAEHRARLEEQDRLFKRGSWNAQRQSSGDSSAADD